MCCSQNRYRRGCVNNAYQILFVVAPWILCSVLQLNRWLFERCSVQTMLAGQLPVDLTVGERLSCKLNANPNNGNVSNDDQSFINQYLLQVRRFMLMQLSASLCRLLFMHT